MVGTKLVLKDGTTYEDSECGYADRRLWCWLNNTTFVKAFADFSDPSKTSEIHWFHGSNETIYTGFTDIDVIRRTEYEPNKYSIDVRLYGENISYEERSIPAKEDVN